MHKRKNIDIRAFKCNLIPMYATNPIQATAPHTAQHTEAPQSSSTLQWLWNSISWSAQTIWNLIPARQQPTNLLESLPDLPIAQIAFYLDRQSLYQLRLTCRQARVATQRVFATLESAEAVAAFASAPNPETKVLLIRGNPQITGNLLFQLLCNCPNLERISGEFRVIPNFYATSTCLNFPRGTTDTIAIAILRRLSFAEIQSATRHFEFINLDFTRITNQTLRAVAAHCPALQCLNIGHTACTASGLKSVVDVCMQLHTVYCAGTRILQAEREDLEGEREDHRAEEVGGGLFEPHSARLNILS